MSASQILKEVYQAHVDHFGEDGNSTAHLIMNKAANQAEQTTPRFCSFVSDL